MNRLTRYQEETVAALEYFGIDPAPDSVRGSGSGITFSFADRQEALETLRNRVRFARGPLGILHSRAVGGVVTEFRSYRRDELHSLHVVLGQARRICGPGPVQPLSEPLGFAQARVSGIDAV